MATLMIAEEARGMFRWVHETYGLGPQVKAWCQGLADRALPPTDGSFDFAKLWDEAGEIAQNSDEVQIAATAAKIGWDVYQSIREKLARRGKGKTVLAANEVFEASVGGHAVPVEVVTVFEVDPVADTVAFLFFENYTPESDNRSQDPTARRPWQ